MGPETKFKLKVQKRLKALSKFWFFKTQERSVKGIPDIVGCGRGHFFGWELKATEDSKITKLQLHTLQLIRDAGGIGVVVSPENFEEHFKELEVLGHQQRGGWF